MKGKVSSNAKGGGYMPPNGAMSIAVPKGKMPQPPAGKTTVRKDAKKPVKVFKKGGKVGC